MMAGTVYFHQDCKVCGRGMRVRIELLGQKIACAHCFAVSVANDDHQLPHARPSLKKRNGRLGHQRHTVGESSWKLTATALCSVRRRIRTYPVARKLRMRFVVP